MKCINHRETDAVGCCRWCGRGLCPACCVEMPEGLACRDKCESDVKSLGEYMRMAISQGGAVKAFRTSGRMSLVFSIFFGVLGVLMVMAAIGTKESKSLYVVQAVLFGGVAIAFLSTWRRNRTAWK
jgi:uncharacterized membrane protein YsdA (DUF1294 family)